MGCYSGHNFSPSHVPLLLLSVSVLSAQHYTIDRLLLSCLLFLFSARLPLPVIAVVLDEHSWPGAFAPSHCSALPPLSHRALVVVAASWSGLEFRQAESARSCLCCLCLTLLLCSPFSLPPELGPHASIVRPVAYAVAPTEPSSGSRYHSLAYYYRTRLIASAPLPARRTTASLCCPPEPRRLVPCCPAAVLHRYFPSEVAAALRLVAARRRSSRARARALGRAGP